jgi:hypothetical protein
MLTNFRHQITAVTSSAPSFFIAFANAETTPNPAAPAPATTTRCLVISAKVK